MPPRRPTLPYAVLVFGTGPRAEVVVRGQQLLACMARFCARNLQP